jgi:ligand-binding sensor domain-containing protein
VIARRALIAVGILLACSPGAFALNPALDVSQYAHTAWKIREGFSKGYVKSMAQTPDGYLWLGTEFGLLRFDGVRAVPWQPPPGQHLPSSEIISLLAARDGTLKGLQVGGVASSLSTRSLLDWISKRSLRIVQALYGPAHSRIPLLGSCAQFRQTACNAMEKMGPSATECFVCMRITRAISGRECGRGCGDGNLALPSSIRWQASRTASKVSAKAMTAHS